MAEYRDSAHAVFDLKYHMVWCTKYRKKVVRGRIAERARDLIRQVCAAREVVIVRGAVSPDRSLAVGSATDSVAGQVGAVHQGALVAAVASRICGTTKQYWGQHMWARGYFCATVGAVDEATIKAYIENQRWDEDDDSFKITAPTKP